MNTVALASRFRPKLWPEVPTGTVLDVGLGQTLSVLFTPTDTATYTTANANVEINVVYASTGFFSPVDNLPVFNSVRAGSAIPVKFSLGGDKGLNIFFAGSPASGMILCNSALPIDAIEETMTAGASSLSYDASSDVYSYVWKTDKKWAGTCRQLVVELADGSTQRANFKLAR